MVNNLVENSQNDMALHIKMRIKYVETHLNYSVIYSTRSKRMLLSRGSVPSSIRRQKQRRSDIQVRAKCLLRQKETS